MSFLTDDDFSVRKESEKLIQAELNHLRKQMIEELKRLAEELKEEVRRGIRQGYTVSGRFVYSPTDNVRLAHGLPESPDTNSFAAYQIACSRLRDAELGILTSVFDKALGMKHGKDYLVEKSVYEESLFVFMSNYAENDEDHHAGIGVQAVIKFTPPL